MCVCRSKRTNPQVLITSVCEYDNKKTPLERLSYWNKKQYADKHGYDLVVHEKGPLLQDPFRELFEEPIESRPPAWSKIDAVSGLSTREACAEFDKHFPANS